MLDGHDITHLSQGKLRPLRRDLQMIFQDPFSSLNPRHTVGTIVGAPFRIQHVCPPGGIKAAVQELLELVGLNPEHYNRYPHEFSGGQRQRIGIARTLALRPKLIIADEPVSALDVSIQAQVVNLLDDLQHELGLTYVVIAHDLSVVRHIADRVAVMYLGKIVELADSGRALRPPAAPVHERAHLRGAGARTRPAGTRPSGSGSCSSATCPARSLRRPGAGSGPGAGRRRRSARATRRRWPRRPRTRYTWSPATSRSATPNDTPAAGCPIGWSPSRPRSVAACRIGTRRSSKSSAPTPARSVAASPALRWCFSLLPAAGRAPGGRTR